MKTAIAQKSNSLPTRVTLLVASMLTVMASATIFESGDRIEYNLRRSRNCNGDISDRLPDFALELAGLRIIDLTI
jgi:hypothetical protein